MSEKGYQKIIDKYTEKQREIDNESFWKRTFD